jgi:hypothetical protein
MICFFESHCNTIYNSIIIYRQIIFIDILQTNFTVGLILSVKPWVKVTCYRTFLVFLILLLPLQFPRYLVTNIAMEKSVGKIHRNLLTKKIPPVFSFVFAKFLVVGLIIIIIIIIIR